MSRWCSATTLKFVQEYRKQECLWNAKLIAYKNKTKREEAYRKMVEAMNLPDFGVPEVKSKIKNLRSTYNQEMKKVEDSKKADSGFNSVYVPNVIWLKDLEPTMNNEGKRHFGDNIDEPQEVICTNHAEHNVRPATTSPQVRARSRSPPRPRKKARSLIRTVRDMKQLHVSINTTENDDDPFDAFGRSVAKQLKKLSGERGLLAQSAIQSVLTDYGIQDLQEKRMVYDTLDQSIGTSSSSFCVTPASPLSKPQIDSLPQSNDSFENYVETTQPALSDQALP